MNSATRATEASVEGLRASTVAVRANTVAVERSTERQQLSGVAMQRNLVALGESTTAIRANTKRLAGAISSSIAMLGAVAMNALAVLASTSALVESRREVHSNTEVLEMLHVSLDKTKTKVGELNDTLAKSGALAAVATLLLGLLYFLSQWSWARLGEHRSESYSKRGDPEMVLFSYLLASTFICLIGVGVFSIRWLGQDAPGGSWSAVSNLLAVLFLGLMTALRLVHAVALAFVTSSRSSWMRVSTWLTTTRIRDSLSSGDDPSRFCLVVFFCIAELLVLVQMGIDTWSQNFERTANGLLIVLFSMFGAGVYDAVICDDFERIS